LFAFAEGRESARAESHQRIIRPTVLHLDRKTAHALHQGPDRAGVACALDQITHPVTKDLAGLN